MVTALMSLRLRPSRALRRAGEGQGTAARDCRQSAVLVDLSLCLDDTHWLNRVMTTAVGEEAAGKGPKKEPIELALARLSAN